MWAFLVLLLFALTLQSLSFVHLTSKLSTSRRGCLQDSSEILRKTEGASDSLSYSNALSENVYEFVRNAKNDYHLNSLFGNFYVQYVGAGKTQRGNPAGGYYRGFIGNLLYQNTGLYQNILYPTFDGDKDKIVVVNQVSGFFLSILPLHVVLYGVARFLNHTERDIAMDIMKSKEAGVMLGERTVEALFESPRIMLGFGALLRSVLTFLGFDFNTVFASLGDKLDALDIVVQVGPTSSVVLDSPYCDTKCRTARGGRGSYFLFRRIHLHNEGEYEHSELWRSIVKKDSVCGRNVATALSFLGAYFGILGRRLVGFSLSVLGVLLACWKGGTFYLFVHILSYLVIFFSQMGAGVVAGWLLGAWVGCGR